MIDAQRAAAHAVTTEDGARAVVHRTKGNRHGPITRLISPGDLGEVLKPFVFLDLFDVDQFRGQGFAPHPHSGIATLTTVLEGSTTYADTTGQSGALQAGAVEWMRAGDGVWHAGEGTQGQAMRGYQLWLALPPELELAPPESRYLPPDSIVGAGAFRVLLGSYEGLHSPIGLAMPVTYLHVRLRDGERFTYRPGAGQTIAWLALNAGRLHTAGVVLQRELAVFAPGIGEIALRAEGSVELAIGAAAPHPYPLITGHHSVHTNPAALAAGERRIADLERSPAVAAMRAA